MSDSASDVVRMTIGIVLKSTSLLTSARTSRPSIFGRFKSSKMRTGRGASAFAAPWRRRNAMASTPSAAWCSRTDLLASRNVSSVSRTSPGLSSTRSTSSATLFQRQWRRLRGRRQLRAAGGQGEMKRGANAKGGLDRDCAAMAFDDFFANRQSDASAVKFLPPVQSLKHPEYSLEELRFDSKPVVANGKHPFVGAVRHSRDVKARDSGPPIFDGIADGVLKPLREPHLVGHDGGQCIMRHERATSLDG